MKKLMLLAVVLAVLTGCNTSVGVQTKLPDYYEKNFSYLDGEEKVNMRVDSGVEVEVEIEMELEEGSIEFTIEDEDGEVIDTISETGNITFETEDKKYYLIITAEDAKGEFEVDWGN